MPDQKDSTLAQVVADRLLHVPDYQRPYAWERKQLEDLWNDLDLLGQKGSHYAGTLVLRPVTADSEQATSEDEEGSVLRHADVVDGQQRLTTCILLLDRLRRAFEKVDDDRAPKIAAKLATTYGTVVVDKATIPRISLGSGLNTHWVDNVLGGHSASGDGMTAAHRRLDAAAAFFDAKIAGLVDGVDAELQLHRLRDLHTRITNGLKFVIYEVSSTAELGTIFETLNERGRGLTDLEKTKNYLLYLSRLIPSTGSDQLADFINHAWSGIYSNLADLPGEVEDPLLRAHWLATQNPDRRNWSGTSSIKTRFDRRRYISHQATLAPTTVGPADDDQAWAKLKADVEDYVRTLQDCSAYLRESLTPGATFSAFDEKDRATAREAGAALRGSGVVALYRPLIFACRLRHPKDGSLYTALVRLVEAYSARVFIIAQRRASAGEQRLHRLAHDFYSGKLTPKELLDGVAATLWQYAPDDRVNSALVSTTESWYPRRGHKHFLYEYEKSLLGAGEEMQPMTDFTGTTTKFQRTTEHILPQNPAKGWAGDCWRKHFTSDELTELRHALGNLVLTLDNPSYSNHCFEAKKGHAQSPTVGKATCYAQGKLHQERDLTAWDSWTPEAIAQRQKKLAVWAMTRWHVDPPATSVDDAAAVEELDQLDELDELEDAASQDDAAMLRTGVLG